MLIDESKVRASETWAKMNMTPFAWLGPAWCAAERVRSLRVLNTTTFIAALRYDRIDAPRIIDGPINGDAFWTYVERVLVPTLSPGDVVVMDNFGSHKSTAIRSAIRKAGAHLWFLSPYSPDLNAIEQVFAKLKHLLRKAAERSKWTCTGFVPVRFSC